MDQPVFGERGELEAGRDEPVAQVGLGEDQARGAAVEGRPDPRQVVRGALGGADLRPGDDRRVVGADELLELGLGFVQVARREVRRLAADLDRLVGGDARQPRARPRRAGLVDPLRADVEMARVLVVERRADVLPVVAQRRLDVLLGGDDHLRALGDQLQQLAELVDRQQLGDVGPIFVGRGDLGQLAMLGRELGRGRDLDAVGLPQAALGERREPAQRLDLDVEQVDADGALLGRRVDVEQAAADRELAALLDLVDALVAGRDELLRGLVEVEQVADAQHEAVRPQRRVGDLLGQRGGADHHDRLLGALGRVGQRVQSGHAQADEVRRRRQVRLVGDAAARVVADRPRGQPGLQVQREIARRAVVADHDQRRAPSVLVGERGDDERPQRLADERGAALVGQLGRSGVVLEMVEEGAQQRPPTLGARASRLSRT